MELTAQISNPRRERGFNLVELVVAIAIVLIVVAIASPTFISTQRNYRATGDAQDVSAQILLAKMRAASDFTQARAYFDTSAKTFRLEIWDRTTNAWAVDNPTGINKLSPGISLGYGVQTNPPPNTQAAIEQAGDCYPGSGASPGGGTIIANAKCVVFNSRGIPIDPAANTATGNDAIYITDGSGVYAATVSATGLIQTWRIDVNDTNAANWKKR
jgi:prepilin-type N-terminal cleavage/methylation domain-containing protein